MKIKKYLVTILFAVFALNAHAQSPTDLIEGAADTLAQRIDGRKDEFRQNRAALYQMIDDILLPRFDRDYAAQLVLGRTWRTASAAQRQRFVDAFYRALLHRYADGVLEFDQSKIEILPYRGGDDDKRTTVRTFVTLDDGTRVPVNYALVNRDGKWLMFDVTIEGISYVRNFRAEMNSEINEKGLEAVIERLEAEAAANDAS